MMLGRGVAERLASASPMSLFAPEVVAAVGEADLCILKLECCISERGVPAPGRVFHFRAPLIAVEALVHLGVDCVTLGLQVEPSLRTPHARARARAR